jgi:hypothetical protein
MLIGANSKRQATVIGLINFLKKRFAAETSRFALSMNSIVHPAESTARYKYFHSVPTFT